MMKSKFDTITGDETAIEIANRFGGSTVELAEAFHLWALAKFVRVKKEACDIVLNENYYDIPIDTDGMVEDILNIKF